MLPYLHTTASFEDVRQIKEKLAYVALDFDAELNLAPTNWQLERTFKLPIEQLLPLLSSAFLLNEPIQIHTSVVQLQVHTQFYSVLFARG